LVSKSPTTIPRTVTCVPLSGLVSVLLCTWLIGVSAGWLRLVQMSGSGAWVVKLLVKSAAMLSGGASWSAT